MKSDAKIVEAVRVLIHHLNVEHNITYREITESVPDVSISSLKQFMSRTKVNFRSDSKLVMELRQYLADQKLLYEESDSSEIQSALTVIDGLTAGHTSYEKAVVRTYEMIYRLLLIEHTGEKFVSAMQKLSGTFVLRQDLNQGPLNSALVIRRKNLAGNDSDAWEFVHVARMQGEARQSDGIAALLNIVLYLGGDIAKGSGVEVLSFGMPPNLSSRIFSGQIMGLSDSNTPYACKAWLIKVGDGCTEELFDELKQDELEIELTKFLDSDQVAKAVSNFDRLRNGLT